MNIILMFQVPNSPDTNVLDLGIWMSLQSAVEKCQRLRRGDKEALHASVMKVLDEVASEEAFKKVFDRLAKNYEIIKKTNGDNNLIEEFRGKAGVAALKSFIPTAVNAAPDLGTVEDEIEFEETVAEEAV